MSYNVITCAFFLLLSPRGIVNRFLSHFSSSRKFSNYGFTFRSSGGRARFSLFYFWLMNIYSGYRIIRHRVIRHLYRLHLSHYVYCFLSLFSYLWLSYLVHISQPLMQDAHTKKASPRGFSTSILSYLCPSLFFCDIMMTSYYEDEMCSNWYYLLCCYPPVDPANLYIKLFIFIIHYYIFHSMKTFACK